MLAKGHDFSRLSLVIVVDADGGLYSADFRAPERLFATLMQVAGRAGRSQASGTHGQVIVQTRFPEHPLFAALERHDYPGFANRLLEEREASELPPFVHQALLRAESRTLQTAIDWLARMKATGLEQIARLDLHRINLFDPVPMAMMRIANTERAQLLIESPSRKTLHRFVGEWLQAMTRESTAPGVRWQLDIDPLEI
jgi:primosomal protein N' (replication factor Y)